MKNKYFGVKCVFRWNRFNGSSLGVEEVIFMVKAANAKAAFVKVKKYGKDISHKAKKKGDWSVLLDETIMESYAMYDPPKGDICEVYSSIHKNRRSLRSVLPFWFPREPARHPSDRNVRTK